jgi:hypothetical protein
MINKKSKMKKVQEEYKKNTHIKVGYKFVLTAEGIRSLQTFDAYSDRMARVLKLKILSRKIVRPIVNTVGSGSLRKLRCGKVSVLEVYRFNGKECKEDKKMCYYSPFATIRKSGMSNEEIRSLPVTSTHYFDLAVYRLGHITSSERPVCRDVNRDCASGIHFFETFDECWEYAVKSGYYFITLPKPK